MWEKPKLGKSQYLIWGFPLNGDRAMLTCVTCVTLLRELGYALLSCDLQFVHLASSHHDKKKKKPYLSCSYMHTISVWADWHHPPWDIKQVKKKKLVGVGNSHWSGQRPLGSCLVSLAHTEYSANRRKKTFSPYPFSVSPPPHWLLSLLSIILRNLHPSEIE